MALNELSILIADDNEMNRWLLAEQLQFWSQDITVACDGKEAWGLLQNRLYSLVFLDVNMPGFNGFELVKKARTESINKLTTIIAITAHVQSHQRHLLIADGFNDCLIKPIVLADLQRVICQWCPPEQGVNSRYYANAVLERVENNHALGRQFLQKLFQEVPLQLVELEQALKSQSVTSALDIAHKLHGSFGFYGFADFRAIAGQLEQCLLDGDTLKAMQQFQIVSSKFADLLAVQSEVQSLMQD